MYIPRVPPAAATRASPSATRLSDHGRLQRLMRRTAAGIADRLPGFRDRRGTGALVAAADAVTPRAGRRWRLQDSPHLGQIIDLYI